MKPLPLPSRFLLNTIHSPALESNPLNSPADRTVSIYLPPQYAQDPLKRFPVVYLLHGYDGHAGNWLMMPHLELISWQPVKMLFKSIGNGMDIEKVPTYPLLDAMISEGLLPPMIIVQPDASLHIPINGGLKGLDGSRATKGSFYIDSPGTGNYATYITTDVISYVDAHFRTIPNRNHRVLIGGSMGGFGALYLGAHYSHLFSAIGALSPANVMKDHLSWKLVVPLIAKLVGQRLAQRFGDIMFQDILQTEDMIFSPDLPLLPTVRFDEKGRVDDYNGKALANWHRYDLLPLYEKKADQMHAVKIWLSCDRSDEYNLAPFAAQMHALLERKGITHRFRDPHDPRTELSPHIFGIAFEVMPALQYCTAHFPRN